MDDRRGMNNVPKVQYHLDTPKTRPLLAEAYPNTNPKQLMPAPVHIISYETIHDHSPPEMVANSHTTSQTMDWLKHPIFNRGLSSDSKIPIAPLEAFDKLWSVHKSIRESGNLPLNKRKKQPKSIK
eukprot:389770-Amorphochlora_amoeboformis.AAC.1